MTIFIIGIIIGWYLMVKLTQILTFKYEVVFGIYKQEKEIGQYEIRNYYETVGWACIMLWFLILPYYF